MENVSMEYFAWVGWEPLVHCAAIGVVIYAALAIVVLVKGEAHR